VSILIGTGDNPPRPLSVDEAEEALREAQEIAKARIAQDQREAKAHAKQMREFERSCEPRVAELEAAFERACAIKDTVPAPTLGQRKLARSWLHGGLTNVVDMLGAEDVAARGDEVASRWLWLARSAADLIGNVLCDFMADCFLGGDHALVQRADAVEREAWKRFADHERFMAGE
jgi:hypothetical protein